MASPQQGGVDLDTAAAKPGTITEQELLHRK